MLFSPLDLCGTPAGGPLAEAQLEHKQWPQRFSLPWGLCPLEALPERAEAWYPRIHRISVLRLTLLATSCLVHPAALVREPL